MNNKKLLRLRIVRLLNFLDYDNFCIPFYPILFASKFINIDYTQIKLRDKIILNEDYFLNLLLINFLIV